MLKYVIAQIPATVLGTLGVFLLLASAHTSPAGSVYEPHYVYLGTMTALLGIVMTAILLFGCIMVDCFAWLAGRKDREVFLREAGPGAAATPVRGLPRGVK